MYVIKVTLFQEGAFVLNVTKTLLTLKPKGWWAIFTEFVQAEAEQSSAWIYLIWILTLIRELRTQQLNGFFQFSDSMNMLCTWHKSDLDQQIHILLIPWLHAWDCPVPSLVVFLSPWGEEEYLPSILMFGWEKTVISEENSN